MTTPTLAERAVSNIVADCFRVLSKLGAGGTGAVYRAERSSNSRAQALAVLPPR